MLTWSQVVSEQSNPRQFEPEFMGGETTFRGLDDKRVTELTEDFYKSREGLTQQVQTVERRVEDMGNKIDKMDVKFEELKQLIMGFQNQGSAVVKLESDAALKEDTESSSTCIEEVTHSNFVRHSANNGNNTMSQFKELLRLKI